MIVPATKQPIRSISCLKVGTNWHIDSGMGGSYEIEFLGPMHDKLCFRCVRDSTCFAWTEAEVLQQVYTHVPDWPFGSMRS